MAGKKEQVMEEPVKTLEMQKINVRIGKLPGKIQVVELDCGASVNDALRISGLEAEGYEIRVNNTPMDPSSKLRDMDTVLLLKKIKGN